MADSQRKRQVAMAGGASAMELLNGLSFALIKGRATQIYAAALDCLSKIG